jgi:hypothetical protein
MWPKPILRPDSPVNDVTCMIIIKACGLCGQWYHCGDVALTSYLHTFHFTCMCEHLKTNNISKVCNHILDLNWWCSWGFQTS